MIPGTRLSIPFCSQKPQEGIWLIPMERQMDRLAALEIFVRVVDTGSFSAVARHQRIGQPAVSKAVVQLEEWLGS